MICEYTDSGGKLDSGHGMIQRPDFHRLFVLQSSHPVIVCFVLFCFVLFCFVLLLSTFFFYSNGNIVL